MTESCSPHSPHPTEQELLDANSLKSASEKRLMIVAAFLSSFNSMILPKFVDIFVWGVGTAVPGTPLRKPSNLFATGACASKTIAHTPRFLRFLRRRTLYIFHKTFEKIIGRLMIGLSLVLFEKWRRSTIEIHPNISSRFSSLGEGIFRGVFYLKNVQRGLLFGIIVRI